MQHLVARQDLRHTGIRLSALAYSCKKLAVLQLDAVHGYRHFRDIQFFFFAIEQIVVAGYVSSAVAYVAKESSQRAIVVEAERQGANCAIGRLQLYAHVHSNAQCRVNRALNRVSLHHRTARLVSEQIHRVGGVVPQQMVGPTAWLAQCVHVAATEKVGLHIHLQQIELPRLDLLVHKLMAGIEATGVAAHGHQTSLLLQRHHLGTVFIHIAQRNFHLHMFAGFQTCDGLRGVHLRGGAQNHRVHFLQSQAVVQVGGDMTYAVFVSHLLGFGQFTPDQRDHFHALNQFDAV